MKTILNIWDKKGNKNFSIINYKDSWKKLNYKPRLFYFYTNGAKRDKDSCLDVALIILYTVFNYTNFSYKNKNKNLCEKCEKQHTRECPNSSKCYDTIEKPYFRLRRIVK